MKTATLKESKVLLEVRRIKEELAGEASADPKYYQRLNGLGAKLLAPYQKNAKKRHVVESGSDGRYRDSNGRIDLKRSDAQNGNLSKPIPGFRSDATVGYMRQVTGQRSLAAIREAAKRANKSKSRT